MTENLSPSLSPPDRNDETVFARLEAELSAFPLPEDRGDAIPFPPKAKEGAGIGELSEKSIHQMLKCCYAPDPTQREVKIGRFVADVYDGRRVAEIQTGQPGRLLPKLRFFLSEGLPVTVVYPMAGIKHLRWIDPETGEITKPRKSGKKERPIDAFHALYPLRELLLHPGLTVELLFFELDEYRLLAAMRESVKRDPPGLNGSRGSCFAGKHCTLRRTIFAFLRKFRIFPNRLPQQTCKRRRSSAAVPHTASRIFWKPSGF